VVNALLSNAELDRLIAELRTHPLAEGELRELKEAVFVSLNQSQPEGIEYAFCLNWADECISISGRRANVPSNPLAPSGDRLPSFALSPRCIYDSDS